MQYRTGPLGFGHVCSARSHFQTSTARRRPNCSVATSIDAPQFQILDADGERISGGSGDLDETVRVPPGDYVVQVRDETQAITVVAGEAQVVEL